MEYIRVVNQNWHMQGFSSGGGHMYFSFTDSLVKTTLSGTVRAQVQIRGGHLGDIDWHDGDIYASFLAEPLPGRVWDDWNGFALYIFDGDDLHLKRKVNMDICDSYKSIAGKPAATRGFNAIDGAAFGREPGTGRERLFIACALRDGEKYADQIILQCTPDGEYEKEYHIHTGNTVFGIQNLDYDAETGDFWFSTYNRNSPYQPAETLFRIGSDLAKVKEKFCFSSPYGFECLGGGRYYASLQDGVNGKRGGTAYLCDESFFSLGLTEEEVARAVYGESGRQG